MTRQQGIVKRRWRRDCVTALVLLLCLWATRLAGLEALPLHNDEGLHLTRAVEVWNLHPFWDISDGKIINHWPIAAFYPQNAPVFVSRVPTIMVAMIGLAAGYALARRLFGNIAALLAGVMWITSPYLFFFERLAQSDAQAGALVVLTLWACWRLWDYPSARHAIFTGLALGVAILFKFTAAPFALLVVVVIAFANRIAWRRRLLYLVLAGLATLASFIVPLLYITLRGRGFFEVALNWVGGGSSGSDGTSFLAENIARLVAQLTDFGPPLWSLALVIGLVTLGIWGGKRGRVSLLAWGLPLIAITVLGSEVLPRHYVVALPLALVAAGMGIGVGLDYISVRARHVVPLQAGYLVALLVIVLVVGFVPFALTAFSDPATLPLPEAVRTQYITEHSAGYGLREAVLDFPRTITQRDIPIIGSMFPDSCRRANFYAETDLRMLCTDAPGLPFIEAALAEQGEVYVLVETPPIIGLAVGTVEGASVEFLGAYPRPGETDESAAVKLWLLRTIE